MYKKFILIGLIIVVTGIIGNEFISQSARKQRKEHAQKDTLCQECVESMDRLMSTLCDMQQRVSSLTGSLYRVLRSCAADDTPAIMQYEVAQLKELSVLLQGVEKQVQALDNALSKEGLLQKALAVI